MFDGISRLASAGGGITELPIDNFASRSTARKLWTRRCERVPPQGHRRAKVPARSGRAGARPVRRPRAARSSNRLRQNCQPPSIPTRATRFLACGGHARGVRLIWGTSMARAVISEAGSRRDLQFSTIEDGLIDFLQYRNASGLNGLFSRRRAIDEQDAEAAGDGGAGRCPGRSGRPRAPPGA